jgi:hypothetical protein
LDYHMLDWLTLSKAICFSTSTNRAAQQIHWGCPSLQTVIWDHLNQFVFERRQWGFQVCTHIVCHKAHCLLPVFRDKPSM